MKPLDPAEYAALQFAAGPDNTFDPDPVTDTDRALAACGLMTIRPCDDEDADELDATEAGHRALRVHLAFLASGGAQ